jgi:hypothetical protein
MKRHPALLLIDAFLGLSALTILVAAWECRAALPLSQIIALPLLGIGAILVALHVLHS